ncbi:general secretion pathway protein C [Alloalcanivorax xenomutans]|uniref:type II secretion system protein N n=1 Tax=Alloalcanivorax xenomutans TaxID=1094342 RepID=UPI000BD0C952|nr:type II secretion system protein N [Alloalcanivorax xenomutans]SOC28056.1 general secretion pathway protein C [Alloalcanivorax xenomutans]
MNRLALIAVLGRAARYLISLVLLGVLVYLVVWTVTLLIHGPKPPERIPADDFPVTAASRNPTLTKVEIESWNLFGEYLSGSGTVEVHSDAPETRMKLTLLGVFHNRMDEHGWAIIQPEGGEAGLYHVGDELVRGATLNALRVDHVLLKRGGRLEKLPLLDWEAMPGIVASAQPARDDKKDDSEVEKLLSDREKAMKTMGVEPVSPETANGYRVIDEEGDLVKKFGFQKGDIIFSANGYPLGTKEDDLLARRSVVDSGIGEIIVRRGSKEFLIEYRTGKSDIRGMAALTAKPSEGG